jgi:hypothetical protein
MLHRASPGRRQGNLPAIRRLPPRERGKVLRVHGFSRRSAVAAPIAARVAADTLSISVQLVVRSGDRSRVG